MIKSYRRYIAENRNLVYIATFVAILLRIGFFMKSLNSEDFGYTFSGSFIDYLFINEYVSFILSVLFTVVVAIQVAHINEKYTLIRGKTALPYVFTVLVLAASPQLVFLSPVYIGICIILICINILFDSYHLEFSSLQSFKIGFLLAAGSVFCPSLILYFLLFWIGFFIMRSSGFKSFLASLFGAAVIFWIVAFVIFWLYKTDLLSFDQFSETDIIRNFKLPEIETGQIILFAIYFVLLIVILIDNYINGYKDKIRIRANLLFIKLALVFSIILYFLFIFQSVFNLTTAIVLSGLIFAHFFALADKKWKISFFTFFVIFYVSGYLYLLSN